MIVSPKPPCVFAAEMGVPVHTAVFRHCAVQQNLVLRSESFYLEYGRTR